MAISPESSLKKTKSENVPPVSTVTRCFAIVIGCNINLLTLQQCERVHDRAHEEPAVFQRGSRA
jgi:hypothetical protein